MSKNPTKAFLSYNHADKEIALKITTVLKAHGIEVWFDEWKIVLRDSIEEEISKGLQATHFVFCTCIAHPKPHSYFLNILSISTNMLLFCSLHVESSDAIY